MHGVEKMMELFFLSLKMYLSLLLCTKSLSTTRWQHVSNYLPVILLLCVY